MMKINIITVGNLKEKYLIDACKEYLKRLSRYHTMNIIEVEEEKLPKNYSPADISRALVKEGQRIERYLTGFVIILDLHGKEMDSVEFASSIEKISLSYDTISFVIGGSYGMSEDIKAKCGLSLRFSKMTFPHQLFRVMLLEQLYRATAINNNILYHK